jgi:hypothetical protein
VIDPDSQKTAKSHGIIHRIQFSFFPSRPILRMQPRFGMTRTSWFAAKRPEGANLEEAGHEDNMLQEENELASGI